MPMNLPITEHRAECPACLECFNSDSAFDRHRVGSYGDPSDPRRCLSVPQMIAKGFTTNLQGYWIRHKRSIGTSSRKPAPRTPTATTPCLSPRPRRCKPRR